MKNNKGFSLLELLVTIAIIGILAVAATTAYIGVIRKGARSEAYSNLESLRLLNEQFFAENGRYTVNQGPNAGNTFADRDVNLNDIQNILGAGDDGLPGFRPGNASIFSYRILQDVAIQIPAGGAITVPWDGTTVAQNPCFVAFSTGIIGTRVAGDIFVIDCNNFRNF